MNRARRGRPGFRNGGPRTRGDEPSKSWKTTAEVSAHAEMNRRSLGYAQEAIVVPAHAVLNRSRANPAPTRIGDPCTRGAEPASTGNSLDAPMDRPDRAILIW